jgi:hypothetical protein
MKKTTHTHIQSYTHIQTREKGEGRETVKNMRNEFFFFFFYVALDKLSLSLLI